MYLLRCHDGRHGRELCAGVPGLLRPFGAESEWSAVYLEQLVLTGVRHHDRLGFRDGNRQRQRLQSGKELAASCSDAEADIYGSIFRYPDKVANGAADSNADSDSDPYTNTSADVHGNPTPTRRNWTPTATATPRPRATATPTPTATRTPTRRATRTPAATATRGRELLQRRRPRLGPYADTQKNALHPAVSERPLRGYFESEVSVRQELIAKRRIRGALIGRLVRRRCALRSVRRGTRV